MTKKIAVLVRERQAEALRVAVGLTLNDDLVEVYVLERQVAATSGNATNIEVLREMAMPLATNCAENPEFELISNAELARRLVACDVILPY